jgi:hypothetical protein
VMKADCFIKSMAALYRASYCISFNSSFSQLGRK